MQEEYYTKSDGTKIKYSEMNNEHLINALAKAYRDIYTSKDDKEFDSYVSKINSLKNQIHKNINDFREKKDKNEQ